MYRTISPYCTQYYFYSVPIHCLLCNTNAYNKRGGLKKIAKNKQKLGNKLAKNVEKQTRIEHRVLASLKAHVTR